MKKEKLKWLVVPLSVLLVIIFFYTVSYYTDTSFEALDEWIEEHSGEIEDLYWGEANNYYVKLNNEWYRLNFERDFFGDYDVREERIGGTPEEIADTLFQWYQKKEIPVEEIEDLLKMFKKKDMNADLIRNRLKEKGVSLDNEKK